MVVFADQLFFFYIVYEDTETGLYVGVQGLVLFLTGSTHAQDFFLERGYIGLKGLLK